MSTQPFVEPTGLRQFLTQIDQHVKQAMCCAAGFTPGMTPLLFTSRDERVISLCVQRFYYGPDAPEGTSYGSAVKFISTTDILLATALAQFACVKTVCAPRPSRPALKLQRAAEKHLLESSLRDCALATREYSREAPCNYTLHLPPVVTRGYCGLWTP